MTDTIEAAPPPRSVEEVKAMLEGTEKGGVRNSIHNCLTVFQYDPVLSGAVAKNLLTERIDLLKPIGRKRRTGSKAMTDTDMKYIRLYLEKTYGLTSEKKIADAADLAADANSYHPIRDYLNGLVWDGKERIRYCLRHFLGADTDNYTFQSLRLFLLGAIHRAFCPGCKFEVMLCLVGGQGAGKSTFFRLLAVKDEWFSDDLRKLDDDNVYRKLQGHWIIEMSEMIATANAKSIEEIKSFLSRQKEVYKIPYETHPEDRLRQCVFGGTSNALDFLPLDRSGNRRFLPVMVYPEQAELTAEISMLEKAVNGYEKHEKDADRFIALIDKYESFDSLTIAMLNEFIEKILVHERDRKGSRETTQEVEIYFNFVGRFVPPAFGEAELTPEELEEHRKKEERKDRLHQNYLKRKASGKHQAYENKIKDKRKADVDAKKAAIRAENIAKGVFVPVCNLPAREPKKGVQTV